jgi:DNA-directed RNA polymerase subunit N (RpoN/RPB10)
MIDGRHSNKKGHLECAYQRFLNKELSRLDDDKKIERWEIYNMISNELVAHGYTTEWDEFKYRITDKENPNDVIIDILDGIERTSLLHTLYGMVEVFKDEDFYVEHKN